jgi:hypothetical protein
VLSPIAYFWIPNRMEQAWFLNETQKEQARTRYQMNIRNYNEEEKFNWAEVKRALVHWPVRHPSPVELLITDSPGLRSRDYPVLRRYYAVWYIDFHVSSNYSQLTTHVLTLGHRLSERWATATSMQTS